MNGITSEDGSFVSAVPKLSVRQHNLNISAWKTQLHFYPPLKNQHQLTLTLKWISGVGKVPERLDLILKDFSLLGAAVMIVSINEDTWQVSLQIEFSSQF